MCSLKILNFVLLLCCCFITSNVALKLKLPSFFSKQRYILAGQTCASRGFTGCCQLPESDCMVRGPFKICYCDKQCHRYQDCCPDIYKIRCYQSNWWNIIRHLLPRVRPPTPSPMTRLPPPTTARPTTAATTDSVVTRSPMSCAARGLNTGPDRCCASTNDCAIRGTGTLCFCHRSCGYGLFNISDQCCPDVRDNGCYPRGCSDIPHMSGCCMHGSNRNNDCAVRKANGSVCYCDEECRGTPQHGYDCCDDINSTCPPSTSELRKVDMELEDMEQLMEVMEMGKTVYDKAAAEYWRRYFKMKREEEKMASVNKRMK